MENQEVQKTAIPANGIELKVVTIEDKTFSVENRLSYFPIPLNGVPANKGEYLLRDSGNNKFYAVILDDCFRLLHLAGISETREEALQEAESHRLKIISQISPIGKYKGRTFFIPFLAFNQSAVF